MVIEEALSAHLLADANVSALAGTRGYPLLIPQDGDLPAWAFQKISGARLYSHDGPSGIAWPRFQITCQAASYSAAKALVNAIRGSLEGYAGTMGGAGGVPVRGIFVDGEVDGYGFDTGTYTVRLDVIIQHEE